MFTGLIQDIGKVTAVRHLDRASRIQIETSIDLSDAVIGESIAINGACFTVVDLERKRFSVDVSSESLSRTTTGRLRHGHRVHLERALRLSDRLGGHLVLGHVDAVGRLQKRRPEGNAHILDFSAPAAVHLFLIEKGSVAIDGVSLTVNNVGTETFSVAIIPHTSEQTLLTDLPVGTPVNLEADVVGKYVAKFLAPWGGVPEKKHRQGIVEILQTAGFLSDDESTKG